MPRFNYYDVFRSLIPRRNILYILFVLPFFTTACSVSTDTSDRVAQKESEFIGCPSFKHQLWDPVYESLLTENTHLDLTNFKIQLKESLEKRNLKSPLLYRRMVELFEFLLKEIPEQRALKNPSEILQALVELEVGIQTTEVKKNLKTRLQMHLQNIENSVEIEDVPCLNPNPEPPPLVDSIQNRLQNFDGGPALGGMRWTFATAYQTCESISKPPISQSTVSLEGIRKITDPNNGYPRRYIDSLSSVQKTHYYLQDPLDKVNCFDVREKPLIYDYGGKPYPQVGSNTQLNFFKDGGYGTSVLGVDCSGLIVAALSTAGLKLSPHRPLKATDVMGYATAAMLDPKANGLECLEPVIAQPQGSLQSGDIAVINGHVVMLEMNSEDPLGLGQIKNEAQCQNINYQMFNFNIIQSSPSKNGIGINRHLAKDYLAGVPVYRDGLEKYAKLFCQARFRQQSITPNVSGFLVIRHNLKPECRAQRIPLTEESCIERCSKVL